jgi:aspartyl aminopeptidase
LKTLKKSLNRERKKIILNRQKEAAIIVPGKRKISEGLKIVISHIDCPRLDLKQIPLYEDTSSNVALFETHYYGGIKKIPVAYNTIVFTRSCL